MSQPALKDFVLAANEYDGDDLYFYTNRNGDVKLHITYDNRLCCDSWELGMAWYYTCRFEPIAVNDYSELLKAWQDHGKERDQECVWNTDW